MKVLIIEDDKLKATQVVAFLRTLGDYEIDHRLSYNSGITAIRGTSRYDLCILDMSLPTYDISTKDEGYDSLPYAGELLLREMQRLKVRIPTVVLTQFTTFPSERAEEKSLAELSFELKQKYSEFFVGSVFYADEETSWQSELAGLLKIT
jgi:CheY-like chemotaxis protein